MTLATALFTLTPPEAEDVYSLALGHSDDAAYYVLDPKRRVVPASQAQFEAMPDDAKLVGKTQLRDSTVVTEFLGFDYSDGEDEHPLVFQTCIHRLTGVLHGGCFATWDEAAADHRRTVTHLRATEARG